MDYNVPVVGKDLPSLVDQLENIAAQVTDLNTAGRFETLGMISLPMFYSKCIPYIFFFKKSNTHFTHFIDNEILNTVNRLLNKNL